MKSFKQLLSNRRRFCLFVGVILLLSLVLWGNYEKRRSEEEFSFQTLQEEIFRSSPVRFEANDDLPPIMIWSASFLDRVATVSLIESDIAVSDSEWLYRIVYNPAEFVHKVGGETCEIIVLIGPESISFDGRLCTTEHDYSVFLDDIKNQYTYAVKNFMEDQ